MLSNLLRTSTLCVFHILLTFTANIYKYSWSVYTYSCVDILLGSNPLLIYHPRAQVMYIAPSTGIFEVMFAAVIWFCMREGADVRYELWHCCSLILGAFVTPTTLQPSGLDVWFGSLSLAQTLTGQTSVSSSSKAQSEGDGKKEVQKRHKPCALKLFIAFN